MRARGKLVAGLSLVVAVGIAGSGCAVPESAVPPVATTSAFVVPTADPAAVGGSDFGPGPYRVEATIAVGENPRSVAIDPETRKAYVAQFAESADQQSVSVIDTRTRRVTAEIPVGRVYPSSPQSIAVDPLTHLVYLVCGNGAGQVLVIDPDSGTVTAVIESGGDPRAIVVDAPRRTLYVANRFSGTVTVIDTVTRSVLATIPVGGRPEALAVDPTTHDLWIASGSAVSVVDSETYAVSSRILMREAPLSIAIDVRSRTAYVTNSDTNSVSLIDTGSRRQTGEVSLGVRGRAMTAIVDPTAHTVYLTSGVFRTVTMIDTRSRTVTAMRNSGITASNKYGSEVFGAAVDPVSGHLYVTNRNADQIEVIAHE